MVVALLVLTGLQACNTGNSSSITEIKFNDLYLEILNEVEALYELKDDDQLAKEILRIKANLPNDIGIIQIRQTNEYDVRDGFKYFHHKTEDIWQMSYGSFPGRRPLFPGLVFGKISLKDGSKKTILHYSKVVNRDKFRYMYLVLDYKVVKELMKRKDLTKIKTSAHYVRTDAFKTRRPF